MRSKKGNSRRFKNRRRLMLILRVLLGFSPNTRMNIIKMKIISSTIKSTLGILI
jgi:hypothetical protein